jgi:hypothetical protein
MLILVVSGCGGAANLANPELESSIKNAFTNTRALESGNLKIVLDGTSSVADPNAEPKEFDFKLAIDAKYGLADPITRLRDIFVNFKLDFEESDVPNSVEAELVVKDKTLFAKLINVSDSLGASSPLPGFTNQWIKFPITEDQAKNPALKGVLKSSKLEGQTEQELAVLELYKKTNFFKEINDKGTVTRNGQKLKEYEVVYDKAAIYTFMVESAKISGEPMNPEQEAQFKNIIDGMELTLTVFITEDKYLAEIEGDLILNFVQDGQTVNVDTDFTVVSSELEEGFKFEAPANALDLMSMMGGFAQMPTQ